MRRGFIALLGAVVMLLALAEPASAATWSSRTLGHTPFSCSDKSLWVARSIQVGATTFAAARDNCGHFAFVSGSPTAGYHIEKTPFVGYSGNRDYVDGLARDGATTYFVRGNPRYAGHLELWERTSAAKYVLLRTLTTAARLGISTSLRFPFAFVSSAGGHWTAAWSQTNKYGQITTYAASTLPGHSGRTELVSALSNTTGNSPAGMVVLSSTRVELVLSRTSSQSVTIYARRSTSTGWSTARTLATAAETNGSAAGLTVMDVAQRSGWTYVFAYRQTTSTGLEVVADNWTKTQRSVVTSKAASFTARMALDAVSGHIWIATVRGTNYDRTDLYTNATGSWTSRQLAFGSNVGLDAITAYSSNPAVYYSPASTPQDTVYYAH